MAQNIIYSPWERTKGPWLCLMTLLLFGLLWLFSFASAFLTSLIKYILWLKFSTGKRQVEAMVRRGREGRRARTIWSCSISVWAFSTDIFLTLLNFKYLRSCVSKSLLNWIFSLRWALVHLHLLCCTGGKRESLKIPIFSTLCPGSAARLVSTPRL